MDELTKLGVTFDNQCNLPTIQDDESEVQYPPRERSEI